MRILRYLLQKLATELVAAGAKVKSSGKKLLRIVREARRFEDGAQAAQVTGNGEHPENHPISPWTIRRP